MLLFITVEKSFREFFYKIKTKIHYFQYKKQSKDKIEIIISHIKQVLPIALLFQTYFLFVELLILQLLGVPNLPQVKRL